MLRLLGRRRAISGGQPDPGPLCLARAPRATVHERVRSRQGSGGVWRVWTFDEVDRRAASGFASVADAYERGRASYPSEAIERIISGLRLSAASSVLDLAAGTGQLSRLLHTRVRRTLAVEPVAAMRAKIAAALPDATVLGGTAEAIPLGQHEVDAVVVSEAFHWFERRQRPPRLPES